MPNCYKDTMLVTKYTWKTTQKKKKKFTIMQINFWKLQLKLDYHVRIVTTVN